MPELDSALRLLEFLAWLLVGGYSWFAQRAKASRDQLDALESNVSGLAMAMASQREVDTLGERVAELELTLERLDERIQHVPRQSEFEQLRSSVSTLDERTKSTLDTVRAFDSRLTDIHTWLLNNR